MRGSPVCYNSDMLNVDTIKQAVFDANKTELSGSALFFYTDKRTLNRDFIDAWYGSVSDRKPQNTSMSEFTIDEIIRRVIDESNTDNFGYATLMKSFKSDSHKKCHNIYITQWCIELSENSKSERLGSEIENLSKRIKNTINKVCLIQSARKRQQSDELSNKFAGKILQNIGDAIRDCKDDNRSFLFEIDRYLNNGINLYRNLAIISIIALIPNELKDDQILGIKEFADAIRRNDEQEHSNKTSNKDIVINSECIRNVGANWYEETKSIGNRFEKLLPEREIIPLAIYVHSKEKEETELLKSIAGTSEHLYLIGEGGIGKTTALFSIMKAAYDPEPDEDETVKQIPLFIELSRAYDPEDFKNGCSRFIEHTIQKQIQNSLQSKMDLGNQLEELFSYRKGEEPEYVLLLDGLNEVSRDELEGRTIVTMVMAETLKIISGWKNVRVILTSRSKESMLDENITQIYLSGIKDENIKWYLEKAELSDTRIDAIMNNKKLLEILRIPLFLVLYANIDNERELLTRGEILHAFFTQKKNSYSIRNRADEISKSREDSGRPEADTSITPEMLSFMLDFIMPAIAWNMVKENTYQISLDKIQNIVMGVLQDKSDISCCGKYGKKCFNEYSVNVNRIAKQIDSVFGKDEEDEEDRAELVVEGIASCLVKQLGVLITNNDKEYEVIHQHVRDYFAALYHINRLRLAVYIYEEYEEKDLAKVCMNEWVDEPLPSQVLMFIGEAMGEAHNAPVYDAVEKKWIIIASSLKKEDEPERTLIRRGFEIFRDYSRQFDKCDDSDEYAEWNLFQILKMSRIDLSGADFSYLDLSLCRANGYRLGNKDFAAVLDGSKLTEEFFLPFGHRGYISSAQYSPDGKYIITASDDGTARVWNTDTREVVPNGILKDHSDKVTSAQFSPDGKHIITASKDGTAKVWSSDTYEVVPNGILEGAYSAQFSPDGKFIVTASKDGTAKVWSSDTYEEVSNGVLEGAYSAQFSPDGKYIVTVSKGGTAKVWSSDTYEVVPNGTIKGHSGQIKSAQFSPDGKYVLTVSWESKANIWSTDTFEVIEDGTIEGVTSAQFSPDGKYLLTASDVRIAKIWNIEEKMKLWGTIFGVTSAHFSPDGEHIVITYLDRIVKILSTDTYEVIPNGVLNNSTVYSVSAQFSPDGKYIVSTYSNGTAKVWSTDTYKVIPSGTLKGHSGRVNSAEFSPNGKYIVTASSDGTAKVWNTDTYEVIPSGTLKGHSGRVNSAEFSPDGKYIVTASSDGTAKVWSTDTYEVVPNGTLNDHRARVNTAQFSPDGKYIVTASWDGTAKVWSTDTYKVVPNGTLNDHRSRVNTAQFSPNGKYIVTTSKDGTAKVWSTDAYEVVPNGTLIDYQAAIASAHFSPDGKYIVTAHEGRIVKIWSADTYKKVPNGVLKGHSNTVNTACFSPNEKYIITSSMDGTVKIWNTDNFLPQKTLCYLPNIEVTNLKINMCENIHISSELLEYLRQNGAIIVRNSETTNHNSQAPDQDDDATNKQVSR